MKKIFAFALVASLAITSLQTSAQRLQSIEKGPVVETVITRDTTTNTDTAITYINTVGSRLASIDAAAVLVSGTIGGKIFLYGRTGANYNLLDSSATLTATAPFKTFLFDKTKFTYYKDYKLEYRTTTTQRSYMVVTYMRRPDE